ncbi:MAG: phage tail tape measure protein [Christensenellaceae bacterium]|nr:phage tail tape measure protein [Christensenellaceae bacterium]
MGEELGVLIKAALDESSLSDISSKIKSLKIEPVKIKLDIDLKSIESQSSVLASKIQRAINESTKSAGSSNLYSSIQKQQDAFLSRNLNAIDLEIKAREEASRRFSAQIKSQIKAQVDAEKLLASQGKKDLFADTLKTRAKVLQGELERIKRVHASITQNADLGAQWQKLFDTAPLVKTQAELSNLQAKVQLLRKTASEESSGIFTGVVGKAAKAWAAMKALDLARRGLKMMADEVINLDGVLTDLQKVQDFTGDGLKNFVGEAYAAAKDVGRVGSEILQATTTFKQSGYALNEALDLGKASLIMLNVGDNMNDAGQAASDLTGIMRGFKMAAGDAIPILDRINEVANNSPIGFDKLTEGLTRSAGVMQQAGTSIDQTIGLLTGGFAQLRNIEKVSTGLNTISSRLRGLSEDGEAIDGLVPKLKQAFKEIANVDIEDDEGQLRGLFDILQDYSKVYDKLSTKQREYLSQLASGVRQSPVLHAIMQQWGDVEKAVQQATNSTGSAMRENEVFLNSIEGKVNLLKSAFQELAVQTIDSGLLKGLVDLGTGVLGLTTNLGGVQNFLVLISGLLAANKWDGITAAFRGITGFIPNMAKAVSIFREGRSEGMGFADALKTAGINASAAQLAVSGLTVALSAAMMIYSSYRRNIEQQRATALSGADKASGSAKSIAKLVADYDRLSKVTNRTAAQEGEFGSTVEQINDVLGKRSDALKNVTAGTREYADALLAASKAELEAQAIALGAGRVAAEGDLKDANKGSWTRNATISSGVLSDASVLWQRGLPNQEIVGQLKAIIGRNAKVTNQYEGEYRPGDSANEILSFYYDLIEARDLLVKKAQETGNAAYTESSAYEDLSTTIAQLSDSAEQYAKQLTEEHKLLYMLDNGIPRTAAQYAAMADSIIAATGAQGAFAESIRASIGNQAEIGGVDLPDTGDATDKIKELGSALKALKEKFELLATAQKEVDDSGSVSFETYQKLAEAGKEYTDVLDEIDGRLVVNTDRMRELEDAQYASQEAEVDHAKTLKQAEYKQVTQQLESVRDAYKDMVEAGKDRSDLNKQKDVINIFKAKQAQIQKEIAQYAALSGQINAAATSLKRYKDAKNTANLGDNTKFAASDTKKTLQEARKTGEYNTDDVKAGLEYFTGKKAKTQKELKSLAKESKKIEDRYFTDNSKKNVRNLADDLLNKKKMGELSKFISKDKNGIINIDDNVTNEQLAEKLGISTDALRDLFNTWKLIDADADWDERIKKLSPTSDQAEEVKTKAKELASNIDDGTKSISEANERRREALEETARLDAGDTSGGRDVPDGVDKPKPEQKPEAQVSPKPDASELSNQIDALESELSGLVDTYNKLSGLNIAVQFTPETAAADITAIREAILQLSQGDNAVTGSVEFTGADDANAKLTTYTANLDTLVKNYKDGKIPTEVFFGMAADFLGNINAAKEYLSSIPKTVDATATVDAQPGETLTVSDLVKDADDDGKLKIEIVPHIEGPIGYTPENDYGGNPPAGSGLPSDNEGFSGYTPPASEETVTVDTEVGDTVTPGELVDGVDSNWNAKIQAHTGVTRKLTPDDLVSGLINGELPIKVKPEVSGQVPIPTSPSASGAKEATGTRHAKKGVALVDEEGPELIEHVKDGTWEIGNGDGARFVPLGDRDIVHTADDTKRIFKRAVSYGGAFRSGAYPDDGGGGKTPTKTKPGKSGNWKKLVKNLFDWIEIRVAALQRVTDNWVKSIKHAVGYVAKNLKIDLAIKGVQDQIKAATDGYLKYGEKLDALRSKMKLSDEMVAKIENGTIDLEKLSPKVRAMVEEYRKWYDKAEALKDSLADLEAQQRDLAKQKLDNIIADYGFKADRLDAVVQNAESKIERKRAIGLEITDKDYASAIEASNKKLSLLAEQRATMQAEFNNLVSSGMIQQGSEDWYEYTGQIEDLDEAMIQAEIGVADFRKAIQQLEIDKMTYALDALKHAQDAAEAVIDSKIGSGKKIAESDYQPLIDASNQQIANMEKQISLMRGYQEGLEQNSERYQELEGDIRSNESAIWDARKAQIEWNDAIKELPLQNLRWANDALQAIKSNIEGLRNLNEAQKIEVDEEYYRSLVDNGMDEIENLEDQNQLLRKRLVDLDIESEKYQEIRAQIEANEQAILGVKAAQEEWVDSIVDIRIDRIKKLQEELQKTNDKYERRIELEKALENLEKTRQRTKLMYVEGEGFVYRRDEKAYKDAEKALKDVQHKEVIAKMEDGIDALEDLKKDNNIYDRNGNIIVPVDWNTLGVNLDVFQQNLMDGLHLDNYAAQLFEQMGLGGAVSYGSVDNSNRPSMEFTMEEGAIQISGAGDPDAVANAVIKKISNEFKMVMPCVTAQALNKRR